MEQTYSVKVALLGESGTGKTCIIDRYVSDVFNEFTDPTRGAAFKSRSLTSRNGKIEVKMLLWDTAGQEIYRSLAPFYYKDADAAVIVYDITNTKSYEALIYWINEVRQNGSPECQIVIAGNKCDCIDKETVDPANARTFAKSNNATFFLTSAKDDSNIEEMFTEIAMHRFPVLRAEFGFEEERVAIDSKIEVPKPQPTIKLATAQQPNKTKGNKKCQCYSTHYRPFSSCSIHATFLQ